MTTFSTLALLLLLSATARGEAADPDNTYKQPHAHSSGADLLHYCEETDRVISQLRCDYYVQGVADLATIPQKGIPLACIPQGQSRTQLMEIAVTNLQSTSPAMLESASAASLILQSFRTAFPCPKALVAAYTQASAQAAATSAPAKQMQAIFKKCATAGDKDAIKKCIDTASNAAKIK